VLLATILGADVLSEHNISHRYIYLCSLLVKNFILNNFALKVLMNCLWWSASCQIKRLNCNAFTMGHKNHRLDCHGFFPRRSYGLQKVSICPQAFFKLYGGSFINKTLNQNFLAHQRWKHKTNTGFVSLRLFSFLYSAFQLFLPSRAALYSKKSWLVL